MPDSSGRLLDADKYRKRRPSGRNTGNRCEVASPLTTVICTGVPPVLGTRKIPLSMPENTTTSSRFQDPPSTGAGTSAIVVASPPALSIFFSVPPASNAMNLLSGDQNGGGAARPTSASGRTRSTNESMSRTQTRMLPSLPAARNAR